MVNINFLEKFEMRIHRSLSKFLDNGGFRELHETLFINFINYMLVIHTTSELNECLFMRRKINILEWINIYNWSGVHKILRHSALDDKNTFQKYVKWDQRYRFEKRSWLKKILHLEQQLHKLSYNWYRYVILVLGGKIKYFWYQWTNYFVVDIFQSYPEKLSRHLHGNSTHKRCKC